LAVGGSALAAFALVALLLLGAVEVVVVVVLVVSVRCGMLVRAAITPATAALVQ